jgi:hypothetical protein
MPGEKEFSKTFKDSKSKVLEIANTNTPRYRNTNSSSF